MTDLSVLIPARNEEFLNRTIEDLLQNIEADTEILVGLDGSWPHVPIEDNSKVTLLHYTDSVGQRAITNRLAGLSNAKYLMKVDAHCAFDKGFDIKMIEAMHDDWAMAPLMRNLHAFNWVCSNGHTRYQGPSGPCKECGEPTIKDVVWIPKTNPSSSTYCFDTEPHFQYFNEYKSRPEYQNKEITESMSLQGSCFMVTRDKYWELKLCDENFGSWGSQGIEVACKMWLSGGSVVINHRTWYAHMFRTQGGDFGFPYEQSGRKVETAKKTAKELFFTGKWEKQIRPLSWLIEKFWPVPGWTQTDLNKLKGTTEPDTSPFPSVGILYYTDNKLWMKLAKLCRKYIAASGLPITSVTLKPTNFGNNIVLPLERGYLTMYKQILAGLEAMTEDVVFFCEHDVLYHSCHFKFIPAKKDTFYYASNYWFLRQDGFAISYDVSPLSGLCAYRDILIIHFKERVDMIEKNGFSYNMGFEPMTHGRIKWEHVYPFEIFKSEFPNVDVDHPGTVTRKRWSKDKFRKQPTNWQEGTIDTIPGWLNLKEILL